MCLLNRLRSFLTGASAALAIMAGTAVLPNQALAQFQMQSPEIDKGGVEFDYQGGYFSGLPERPNEATRHGH